MTILPLDAIHLRGGGTLGDQRFYLRHLIRLTTQQDFNRPIRKIVGVTTEARFPRHPADIGPKTYTLNAAGDPTVSTYSHGKLPILTPLLAAQARQLIDLRFMYNSRLPASTLNGRKNTMVTIYHNPRCSKSRQTLAILEENGIEAEVIEYLNTPPDAATLKVILQKLGMSARELLRKGEDAYKENDLGRPELSDDKLIDYMVRFPKLIQRPIVIKGDKAVLGRPPENVQELIS